MNKTLNLVAITTTILLMQGCSTPSKYPTEVASNLFHRQNVDVLSPQAYPIKNPQTVAIFNQEKSPHAPYRIIGVATVSNYNFIGFKRKDDTMHAMIKNLAASIGGDGVIEVRQDKHAMQAKVIAFQKILI